MVEALAKRFSGYLVSIRVTDEENREIVSYGLFHIFSSALQLTILAITGLLFGMTPQIIAYTIFFGSLKRYAGGAHANRHWVCLWGFTLLANASCFLCFLISIQMRWYGSITAASITMLIVLIKAPVTHPNNPKPAHKLIKLRRLSIMIGFIQLTVIVTASFIAPEQAYISILCGSVGGLTAAVTLLLPMPGENEGR